MRRKKEKEEQKNEKYQKTRGCGSGLCDAVHRRSRNDDRRSGRRSNPERGSENVSAEPPAPVFYKVLSAAASENMPKTQRTHAERRFLQNPAEKIPFDS